MTRRRTLLLLLLAVAILVPAGIAFADSRGSLDDSVPATARFHDLDVAKAAGYGVTVEDLAKKTCIAQAGAGGMGVHMLNPDLLDENIDAPAGNRYGLPDFYALHSWIWKPNPSGVFQPYNPRVVCP